MLGPVVLILLALLLALMFLHAAHEGWDGAEMGAVCIAIATVLGAVIQVRVAWRAPSLRVVSRFDRGPPRGLAVSFAPLAACAACNAFPLRR